MSLVDKESGDLTRWGVAVLFVGAVVFIGVGMAVDRSRAYRKYPKVIEVKHTTSQQENFEPPPVFANYQAMPARPIADREGCQTYLGAPPGWVPFPRGENPYVEYPYWTVSFWVKMNSLDVTESFALMRKGTISQNGTPSILYVRRPVVNFAGQEIPGPQTGSTGCLMFTYKILDRRTKNYFGNNYATLCPSPKPLRAGVWKHVAWVQNGCEMTLYEDGEPVFYNPNAVLDMSPGQLRFSTGDNHVATLRNLIVCKGAKNEAQMKLIYQTTNPGFKEGISSQFQKLIGVHGTFRPSKSAPTATYKAFKEGISGNFYKLVEVENYSSPKKRAYLRGLYANMRNPKLLYQ